MPQLRLTDPNGYTVPGTVRTVTTDQIEAATANLRTETAQYDSDHWAEFGFHLDTRQYEVQVHPDPLPTTPDQLADLLLTPGADTNQISEQLTIQVGDRPARRLLAQAHGIAADRLFAAA